NICRARRRATPGCLGARPRETPFQPFPHDAASNPGARWPTSGRRGDSMSLVAIALAVLATPPSAADDSLSGSQRPVTAVRTAVPIVIDGLLTEPVWSNGNAATWFRQSDPVEGAAPSQRTEVRMAYDDEALYVGARMYDTAPESILARLS